MFSHKITRSSAKVIEGNLIISLPDARNPIVWRMALGEAKAAALEVREQGSDYMLILKNAKGDVTEIAPFEKKEVAADALMIIAKAMQESHGQISRANDNVYVPRPSGQGWKWLIPLILIIAAIFLFSRSSAVLPIDYAAQGSATGVATAPAEQTGVPLSADSILGPM